MDSADNVVLIGGPGTGKSHIATALGIQAVEHHRRKATKEHRNITRNCSLRLAPCPACGAASTMVATISSTLPNP